jgi:hypothetical protein
MVHPQHYPQLKHDNSNMILKCSDVLVIGNHIQTGSIFSGLLNEYSTEDIVHAVNMNLIIISFSKTTSITLVFVKV